MSRFGRQEQPQPFIAQSSDTTGSKPVGRLTQGRYGLFGRRYGSFAGKAGGGAFPQSVTLVGVISGAVGYSPLTTAYALSINAISTAERVTNPALAASYSINPVSFNNDIRIGMATQSSSYAVTPIALFATGAAGYPVRGSQYALALAAIDTAQSAGILALSDILILHPASMPAGDIISYPTLTATYQAALRSAAVDARVGNVIRGSSYAAAVPGVDTLAVVNRAVATATSAIALRALARTDNAGRVAISTSKALSLYATPLVDRVSRPTIASLSTLSLTGIPTTVAVNRPVITSTRAIALAGIKSDELLSRIIAAPGPVAIQLIGIPSSEFVQSGVVYRVFLGSGVFGDQIFIVPVGGLF